MKWILFLGLLMCCGVVLSGSTKVDKVEWSDNDEILNVFVVPHSHNDPGWWMTFEEYYSKWTRGIISSVISALAEDERRTFIWCETSFFSLWWNEQDETKHELVRKLVNNGQLEFVGGGWVMNDEASVTISDVISQYSYGHHWLLSNVGPNAVPSIGWAIDPFGHSPAMAWASREMGFKGMVINRVQKDIKNKWRDDHNLEFRWEKEWNMDSSSCLRDNDFEVDHWEGEGMLTHMLPYKLYDIPNTCGPDWDICAEFDFERPQAKAITNNNIKERSETLLGQYRKKAMSFDHNNLLVPLGDDFKYKDLPMTLKMMTNYQLIFDYLNSNSDYKVRIRFATLSEYFEAVKRSTEANELPQYNGDFFTYNDEDQDFWSGFYTTRPYLKRLIRTTSSTLRTAQSLYALYYSDALSDHIISDQSLRTNQFSALEDGLKALSLVQHHDGVTGTCRQTVADDYTNKLLSSSSSMNNLIRSLSSSFLCSTLPSLLVSPINENGQSPHLNEFAHTIVDQKTKDHPIIKTINLEEGDQTIILFNSLSYQIKQLIKLEINKCDVEIINNVNMKKEIIQVIPEINFSILDSNKEEEITKYSVFFVADLPPLSYTTYSIKSITQLDLSALPTQILTKNSKLNLISFSSCSRSKEFQSIFNFNSIQKFKISNSKYDIDINDESGLINSIYINQFERKVQMDQSYYTYGTRGGAYLFKPNGPSSPLSIHPSLLLISGQVVDQIQSLSSPPNPSTLIRLVKLNNNKNNNNNNNNNINNIYEEGEEITKSIQIINYISMNDRDYNNKELVTKFTTDLENRNIIYTDGNNLDLIPRTYDPFLPIQGNFYPISAMFTIPDFNEQIQMEVMTNQPFGMGLLPDGDFEIVLDRRTMQDDARGMGQAVTDNANLAVNIWIAFERISSIDRSVTPLTRHLSNQLEHPPQIMFTPKQQWDLSNCLPSFYFISSQNANQNVNLFALQPYSKNSNQIIIRLDLLTENLPAQKFQLKSFLSLGNLENRSQFTLSLLHKIDDNVDANVVLVPMAMKTFVASLVAKTSPIYNNNDNSNNIVKDFPFYLVDKEVEKFQIPPPVEDTKNNLILNNNKNLIENNNNDINFNGEEEKIEEVYLLVKGDLNVQNQLMNGDFDQDPVQDFSKQFLNSLSHTGVKNFHLVNVQVIPDRQSYFLFIICAVVLFFWITILYSKRKRYYRPL